MKLSVNLVLGVVAPQAMMQLDDALRLHLQL